MAYSFRVVVRLQFAISYVATETMKTQATTAAQITKAIVVFSPVSRRSIAGSVLSMCTLVKPGLDARFTFALLFCVGSSFI